MSNKVCLLVIIFAWHERDMLKTFIKRQEAKQGQAAALHCRYNYFYPVTRTPTHLQLAYFCPPKLSPLHSLYFLYTLFKKDIDLT